MGTNKTQSKYDRGIQAGIMTLIQTMFFVFPLEKASETHLKCPSVFPEEMTLYIIILL